MRNVFWSITSKINHCANQLISSKKKNNVIVNDKTEELQTSFMPNHQYVPVHGMQWVWLVMVAPLVVSHVDGYRCVKRGEEMMGTCAEQTESETTATVIVEDLF